MRPRVPNNDAVYVPYAGTVTEITKDSITIQWTATPGEQPRKFLLSDTLAAGKIPMEPRLIPGRERGYSLLASSMYRITDVKVGDSVGIHYAHLSGINICDHICIQRRPGGLVPPLPEEAEKLSTPAGIFQAKFPGRPIPAELKNWSHIPYHERMNAHWDRQAPMPREVGVTGPPISP
jgi:hypothetical protein